MDWEQLLDRAYPAGKRNSIFYSRGEHDDLRMGDIVRTWDRHDQIPDLLASRPRTILLGAPDDLGVTRGKGRPGARHGPQAIRRAFYRLTPGFLEGAGEDVIDLGNLRLGKIDDEEERLADTHIRLEEAVYCLALTGATVIVLGGGQDLSYASAMGYARAHRNLRRKHRLEQGQNVEAVDWFGLINIDKFLDVRDPDTSGINSGTAFFRLLEDAEAPVDGPNYVAFGIQDQHCSPRHRAYLQQKGARMVSLEQFWLGRENLLNAFKEALDLAGDGTISTIVSFDLHASTLPGVSSPSPLGLNPGQCCALASLAGEREVGLFELMEVAPPHDDPQEPTSRLAANMLFYFLLGMASRLPG